MNSPTMKYINFRYCCYSVFIAIILLILLSFWPKSLTCAFMFLFVLYIYLGFIKYSFIISDHKFRKMIILIIGLSFIDLILWYAVMLPLALATYSSHLPNSSLALVSFYSFYYAVGGSIYLVSYYSFSLIRNAEIVFFKKLSTLNLYLFPVASGNFILYILNIYKRGLTIPVLFIILKLTTLVITIWIAFWKFGLFSHLHSKYETLDSKL
jgi:hypothetical protein